MKTYLLVLLSSFIYLASFAQGNDTLPLVGLSRNATLHFISPEPISYADISTAALKGDLPLKNILRVKISSDSASRIINNADAGILTIVGETFIAQYRIYFLPTWESSGKPTIVEILPSHCRPIATAVGMPVAEIKAHALSLLGKRGVGHVAKEEKYGISASLLQVFTAGDYIFLDLRFSNATNLPFDIDALSFSIEDKKITKATNVQSLAIEPVFRLHGRESFKKNFRNIYVFKKLTFPENKVFSISLKEKQVSGRNLVLNVPYRNILRADTF